MSDIPSLDPAEREPGARRGPLERMMPLLTLVIAVTAIGLAAWEGLENRRHNRLSVKPRIGAEIDAGRNGSTEFVRLAIESTGLGPAVITAFRIYFDGALQDTANDVGTGRWASVERVLQADHDITQMNAQAFGGGYYLPPGRETIVFEAMRPQSAEGDTSLPLLDILDRLAIQICYCSVYDSDCDDVALTTADFALQACPVD